MIKLKDIVLEILSEQPHLFLDNGEAIDLRIEMYKTPIEHRNMLKYAFYYGKGVFAKNSSTLPTKGNVVFAHDKMRPARPGDERDLPHLPDDWESFVARG